MKTRNPCGEILLGEFQLCTLGTSVYYIMSGAVSRMEFDSHTNLIIAHFVWRSIFKDYNEIIAKTMINFVLEK